MGVAAHSMFVGILEVLRWRVLAVRSLGLPGSAVVLVNGIPEGRFWREVVDRRLVLR